jgi:cell division protein FtsI (penicillin-binding protein 3)
MVLQPGSFQRNNIPDIDFQGKESLGGSGTDMVLTLDFALQKQLEARFREYLAAHGAEKGMGLLLEPGSGRILALVNQPSFNPNYFWKAKESNRVNRIYNHVLDKELIRAILFRAAAIEREGLQGPGLLPETIAAPNYGFSDVNLEAFEKQIQLYGSVFGNWEAKSDYEPKVEAPAVTGVQVGVTLASLVNGGWRITPYVVDSIYDHATKTRFRRSGDATERSHVLDPALGVKLRRELFTKWLVDQEDLVVFFANHAQINKENGLSRYSIQELFVGLAPSKQPKYLLLMAVEQDHLFPDVADGRRENMTLAHQGKDLLTVLAKDQGVEDTNDSPPTRSQENRRQFFISKRLNLSEPMEKAGEVVAVMPTLRGMSLRKGLQRLNPHKVAVKISGSGTIVAQYPLPGASLRGVNECVLTLNRK